MRMHTCARVRVMEDLGDIVKKLDDSRGKLCLTSSVMRGMQVPGQYHKVSK